jgi:hypothetical protein
MHAPKNRHLRAVIEIGFIIFLFYSNLLMGEFTGVAGRGKTLAYALHDIFTLKTVLIALVTSVVGHLCIVLLRDKS